MSIKSGFGSWVSDATSFNVYQLLVRSDTEVSHLLPPAGRPLMGMGPMWKIAWNAHYET